MSIVAEPVATAPAAVEISGLVKRFPSAKGGTTTVIDGVDLVLAPGEFVTVIGPSGCGKSTLLACVAGLVEHEGGTISARGTRVHGPGPDRVVVFQQASLLPWRTVRRNVAYGLETAGRPRAQITQRVEEVIRMVGLAGSEELFPRQISGGMQQRTNLARALAMDAETILMDEPFGALDAITRRGLQDELLQLHRKLGKSVLFITHDIDEAIYLADRVVVMGTRPGRIVHTQDVPFERPRDRAITNSPEFRAIAADLDTRLHAP